jgi:ATP-dependent DNA helicase RecG
MNKEMKSLILKGEGKGVRKLKASEENLIGKAVSALLNADGGTCILGMDGDQVQGIAHPDELKRKITLRLIQKIVPQAPMYAEVEEVDGKSVLIIRVGKGSKPPYLYDGRIYVSDGSKERTAGVADITQLIHNRQKAEMHWERQIAGEIGWDDMDLGSIRAVMAKAKAKSHPDTSDSDVSGFLMNLGLLQNGNFTNAAVVLFAKSPTQWLPQCRVRIVEFPDGRAGDRYLFDEMLDGNLFHVFEKVQSILRARFPVESHFHKEEWQRTDSRKYPMDALDEGVMNALIHRDFSNASGSVVVEISGDRVEIKNFGGLPNGWSANRLGESHVSLPRNPDIAHVCYLNGWIEKLGRGTLLILEKCKEAGLPKPVWKVNGEVTTLTLFARSPKRKANLTKDGLSTRQQQILGILTAQEVFTIQDLLNMLGYPVSGRTIRSDLKTLVEGGWVIKNGNGPTTGYLLSGK